MSVSVEKMKVVQTYTITFCAWFDKLPTEAFEMIESAYTENSLYDIECLSGERSLKAVVN